MTGDGEMNTLDRSTIPKAPVDPSDKPKAEPPCVIDEVARMMAESYIKNGLAQFVADKYSTYLHTKIEPDAESLARAISARNRRIAAELKARLRLELRGPPI